MPDLPSVKSKVLLLTIISFLAGVLVWLAFFWSPVGPDSAGGHGVDSAVVASKAPIGGDFTLQGPDGPVALADYRGKVVLLYFGYTFCPDVCPTALSLVAQALSGLTPGELDKTRGIFISVDPERDTSEVLKAYAPFFHANIVGATGSVDQVAKVAQQYGASYMKQKPDSDGLYSVDHSSFTYVIDGDGKLAAILPHGTPPQTIVDKVRALLGNAKPA